MSWTTLLFSFQGRINRARYWLAVLIYTLVSIAFVFFLVAMIGSNMNDLFSLAGAGLLVWLVGAALYLLAIWSGFATAIKRLHDRDKSGWWIVVFFFGPSVLGALQATAADPMAAFLLGLGSVAIGLWGFVELGCLRGTSGPNRYGRDPLGSGIEIPQR